MATEAEQKVTDNVDAVSEYLASNYGYRYTRDNKKSLENSFRFLARASLFLLNYVRGDLDEWGYIDSEKNPAIYLEFHRSKLTVEAVEILWRMLVRFNGAKHPEYDMILNAFWDECHREHPDFQAHALIAAAKSKHLFFAPVGKKIWLYGMGAHSKVFFETSTLEDMKSAFKTDKLSGKHFFKSLDVPTAGYETAESYDGVLAAAKSIGFPCAVKPIDSGAGKGVTANIQTSEEVAFAYAEAGKYVNGSEQIMVEAFVPGRDYRLVVVGGKFVSCVQREAPVVHGDGVHTIRTLIHRQINQYRTRNLYASRYRRPVPIDAAVTEMLALQHLTLESVPPAGEAIKLRRNDNLSTGGSAKIVDNVHPEIIRFAETMAGASGLYSMGIDYITTDITLSPLESGGKFVEINRTQGIDVLLAADYDVASAGRIFLGDSVENIPVHLYILDAPGLKKFFDAYAGEYALFLPDTVVKRGEAAKSGDAHFVQTLHRIFLDKSLSALDIVATVEFVENFGFPTEYIEKVFAEKSCLSDRVRQTIAHLQCDTEWIEID